MYYPVPQDWYPNIILSHRTGIHVLSCPTGLVSMYFPVPQAKLGNRSDEAMKQ
jgi:hypothetical protein